MPVYMNINISIRMSINMAMIHEFEDEYSVSMSTN